MSRPVYTPKYEETETDIRTRMLDRIDDTWRKEPGDFIYDAVAPSPLEIKNLEINQDNILQNGFAMYAEAEYLDLRLEEIGLTRIAATQSKRSISVTADAGVVIPVDQVASTVVLDDGGNPVEFTVDSEVTFAVAGTLTVNLTSTLAGAFTDVPVGSEFIFQPSIPGVRVIADNTQIVHGEDAETDEAAWTRYQDRVANPDTGGNRNDYIRWAKEVEGVGAAKCIPRWNGNGTVKVVIVNATMTPASAQLVTDVQNYIDPSSTGLGDGKAPCGASVTVIAAASVPINIAATVTYDDMTPPATGKQAYIDLLTAYLAEIIFTSQAVSYAKVGGLLITTPGVKNYTGLTVNGGTADIATGAEAVATIGTVSV